MKHIAILLPAMRMGGAEKICLNFLDYITKDYQVTMILSKKEGELLPQVPAGIEIVEDRLLTFKEVVKSDLKKLNIKNLLKDFSYFLKIKIGKDSEKNYRYLVSRTPRRTEHYDCAISYVANVSTQIFNLIDRIDADMKIGWLHGETTELKDTKLFATYYKKMDKLFAVSNVTRHHFVERFPECENCLEVYYNPIRVQDVISRSTSNTPFEFSKKETNLVTVGRISPEKGMDMIPDIVEILVSKGHQIHWFIVGDGPGRQNVENKIKDKKLDRFITLTGNQLNPYPFIRNCDLYVQPSYEEGYSTTICEAGILGKAMIGTTTSGGIREQLEDGVDGILADPNPESLAEKIEFLILNDNIKNEMERNILKKDFSNAGEYTKLRKVLG